MADEDGTQFAGMILGAIGVAVTLRGVFHDGGAAMIALGLLGAAAGTALIFRGHAQGR